MTPPNNVHNSGINPALPSEDGNLGAKAGVPSEVHLTKEGKENLLAKRMRKTPEISLYFTF